ncbi:MAG: site-specific DNA-methyltransferase [Phycisphaerales bacterium]|jgi:adenine-specific DNA-methyltransferase|nr:hypothetical protein [Phycisphaeraceae bacterium]
MPPANTAITDSKFNALKAKLRELFELDKSDLDFGIYRIIAAKNKEVTEFLDRQLKDVVKATLAAHGAGATDQVQAELDKAIDQARTLGADPEALPKVKELRSRLESAGGAAAAELEADIYNHLLAFFGRYYDEGDFISQRRYKGDTYAIPYSGEEVTLHWANKDQYYIKSGEWHKDYRFKVGGSSDKTVRFKLIEATQEVGNNKEADDAKRRYILAIENPVEEAQGTLTLRFEFRVPTQADKDRAAGGAVAVFGGDYAKASNPKKGDEREQFCADAEKRAVAAMPEAWKALIAAPGAAATADKPARTLLGKHLDHFSARNTFDYFIHKDLGGFLRRELDFYIKNEVVRLDDLESLPPDHLQRVQGKVKAIRAVASRLIAFLGSLEEFQKKMWLKKKFVLNTNWLVTVDRIPPALRDVVAQNAEQWAEWERLGFKPENTGDAGLFGGAAWGTRAYLDACDKLVVSTRFFDMAFQQTLLASEEVSLGTRMLDDAIAGTLINGDNEHAIRLLLHRLADQVDCLYLDPPYNTDGGPINYKNGFKSSSWMSMIHCRLATSDAFLRRDDGILCMTIDDFQQKELHAIIESVFGRRSLAGTVVVRSNPSGRPVPSGFAQSHEYAIFATKGPGASVGLLPRSDDQAARYKEEDERGRFMWELFRKRGSASERRERPSMYFPLFLRSAENALRVPTLEWDNSGNAWVLQEQPHADEVVLWPIDENGVERRWRWSLERTRDEICQLRAERNGTDWTVYYRYRPMLDGVLPTTVWSDAKYSATEHGTGVLKKLFADFNVFSYPKSIYAVSDCIAVAGLAERTNGLCLDYFAGSGTTGHAVIDLNRRDGGHRRFILVEMGAHYHRVVVPRIAKVIFCPEWKDGKAQSHRDGLSSLVKCLSLESYEDALNNLPAPSGTLLDGRSAAEKEALITYGLDLELGPHLLNLDGFRDPWGYTINAQLAGDAEIRRHRVDLVETFNYLIGLKVHAYGPLERYSADFDRAAHADGLGRMKLTGRLRRDARGDGEAPYVFQRVEGELNDGNGTRVLVVWRKLTDDPEKDAAVLDAWMARHRESTRERMEHRDYHLIYINGPVTLPQPTAEIRTVCPTEETFKIKMFEDTDSASQVGGGHG